VKLVLSTAQPHGGLLPTLGTTYAEFYRPPPSPKSVHHYQPRRAMMMMAARSRPLGTSTAMVAPVAGGSDEELAYCRSSPEMCEVMKVQTTKASEQILASTFTIPQAKSIPADDSEHKVSHLQNVYNYAMGCRGRGKEREWQRRRR
jgi:hypothetical protein